MTLRCQELGCRRESRILFRNVEFELDAGDVLQVVGDNGSGKSTLLRTLVGLRPPDAGAVYWQAADVHRSPTLFHGHLLFIGHAPGVKDYLTAVENVMQCEMLTGEDAEADVLAALAQVGLAEYAYSLVRTLSQGQRRRVALARLHLARHKQIWILDEPFVGLDAGAVEALRFTMQAFQAKGGIIVFTTHQDIGPWSARQLRLGRSV